MENTENSPVPQSDPSDLQAQFDSLRLLVILALVLLIIVTGTFWIYLRWQVKWVDRELGALRPMIAQYQKVTLPATDDFVQRLLDFAKTHPDFAPILNKYTKPPGATGAPPARVSAPAPGAQKK